MESDDPRAGFATVDSSRDPRHFVRLVDSLNATEQAKAYKRQTILLLGATPGNKVLDVGCGDGDDVRELATLVGPTGLAVGVDRSETMIAEARRRAPGLGPSVEFRVGEAYSLDLASDTFDACRADRVFHHLDEPSRALSEMVRVAKPGARIVTSDPDFGSIVIDHPNRALSRRVMDLFGDNYRNGYVARHVAALFTQAGLTDVAVALSPVLMADYPTANLILGLEESVGRAVDQGAVTASEGASWLADLRAADETGCFVAAILVFIGSGRKP